MELRLGDRRYDVTQRALVMGILNRTRDSFYDGGPFHNLDALLARADELVADGADVLEIGARPGGVGVSDVTEDAEATLACEAITTLRSRVDVPLAVDTWRGAVAREAFAAGAVLGNDMSGAFDGGYLDAAGPRQRRARTRDGGRLRDRRPRRSAAAPGARRTRGSPRGRPGRRSSVESLTPAPVKGQGSCPGWRGPRPPLVRSSVDGVGDTSTGSRSTPV